MARSILGIVAGYLIFALTAVLLFRTTQHDPHAPVELGFGAMSILYGAFFAAAGGYFAGWIAGRREFVHGCMVGALIAVGAIISLIAQPRAGAVWSQLAALCIMAPMAAVGGFVCAICVRKPKRPS